MRAKTTKIASMIGVVAAVSAASAPAGLAYIPDPGPFHSSAPHLTVRLRHVKASNSFRLELPVHIWGDVAGGGPAPRLDS
jgi:hypothetical protein